MNFRLLISFFNVNNLFFNIFSLNNILLHFFSVIDIFIISLVSKYSDIHTITSSINIIFNNSLNLIKLN